MSISYTTCSMVIGMFKRGLSEAERETFRCLYDHDHACFSEGPWQIFEGKNAILFCFHLPSGTSNVDPTVTGGASVVFFKSTNSTVPRKNFGEDHPDNYPFVDPEQILLDYEDLLKKMYKNPVPKKEKQLCSSAAGRIRPTWTSQDALFV